MWIVVVSLDHSGQIWGIFVICMYYSYVFISCDRLVTEPKKNKILELLVELCLLSVPLQLKGTTLCIEIIKGAYDTSATNVTPPLIMRFGLNFDISQKKR